MIYVRRYTVAKIQTPVPIGTVSTNVGKFLNGIPVNSPMYKRAPGLLEADLGPELVTLNPRAGTCFGFNEVAASVWRNLEEPKTFSELHESLLQEYDVDVEQCALELSELLVDLQSRGLVARTDCASRTKGRT